MQHFVMHIEIGKLLKILFFLTLLMKVEKHKKGGLNCVFRIKTFSK